MSAILISLLLPITCTTIGSTLIILIKYQSLNLKTFLYNVTIGIMVSSALFSLLIPSMKLDNMFKIPTFILSIIGFSVGVLLFFIIEICNQTKDDNVFAYAVNLHNIPEGISLGVLLVGYAFAKEIDVKAIYTLAISISLHNIFEGFIVSLKYQTKTNSNFKSIKAGIISGISEPIAFCFTIALSSLVTWVMPILLSFASGAMIYVVVCDLIPEIKGQNKFIAILGLIVGFIIVLILE